MSNAHIDPDREAWEVFKSLPRDQPIHMLNLIKLKPKAEYPPDHPDHGKNISGLEAYRAYGRTTSPILKRLGGRQVWVGHPQVMVTGPAGERWDLAFIARGARRGLRRVAARNEGNLAFAPPARGAKIGACWLFVPTANAVTATCRRTAPTRGSAASNAPSAPSAWRPA